MNDLDALNAAHSALSRGDWEGAIAEFESAMARSSGDARAWEGLATANWWLDRQDAVLEARQEAFRLFLQQDDRRAAARLATLIAFDYVDYRGDTAVASGWLQRASRLLEGLEPGTEHAWVHLYEGFVDLMYRGDTAAARAHNNEGAALGERLGDIHIRMMAVTLEGLILIREGKVPDGMRRLDEAMAAAVDGEMTDLANIGQTCCALIYACEAVADYDRAAQWCAQALEFCRRVGLTSFFAICRNYYATVLIWRGEWDTAEAELSAAMAALREPRPSYARESLAKLGELRRRQGRLDEAEALFAQAEPHMLALLGRASLHLDRGEADAALEYAERFLRRIGAEDQAERVFGLDLMVCASLARGDVAAAETNLSALHEEARGVGTAALRATALACHGALLEAKDDLTGARAAYEDAIDLFGTTAAAFDAARVRLDLARVLGRLGRDGPGLEQATLASETFKRLGAALYTERAAGLIDQLSKDLGPPPSGSLPYGLSRREAEVLWLIARGRTNQDIANELVLSIRTVERHISTVYEKLQVHGPAARAAAASIALSLRDDTQA